MTHMKAKVEAFALGLRELSQDVEPKLHLVSPLARQEWRTFQSTWPSDSQIRQGAKGVTEGHLEALTQKARRFKEIVHGLALKGPSKPPRHAFDEDAAGIRVSVGGRVVFPEQLRQRVRAGRAGVIHHSTELDGRTSAACGASSPRPASRAWGNVSCDGCLAMAPAETRRQLEQDDEEVQRQGSDRR